MQSHGIDVAVGEDPLFPLVRDRRKAHGQPKSKRRIHVKPGELGRLLQGVLLSPSKHAPSVALNRIHGFTGILWNLRKGRCPARDVAFDLRALFGPVVVSRQVHIPPSLCAFNHTLYGTEAVHVTYLLPSVAIGPSVRHPPLRPPPSESRPRYSNG